VHGNNMLSSAPFSPSNHEEMRTNKACRTISTDSTFPRSSAYRSGLQQPLRPPTPCDSVNRGQRSHEPPLDMNELLALFTGLAGKPATQRFSFSVRIFGGLVGPPHRWDLSISLGTGRLDQDAHTHTHTHYVFLTLGNGWTPGSRDDTPTTLRLPPGPLECFFPKGCLPACLHSGWGTTHQDEWLG
jgi:hypothetical protein